MSVCNNILQSYPASPENPESNRKIPSYQHHTGIVLESQRFPLQQSLYNNVYQHLPSPRGDSQSSSRGNLFSSRSSEWNKLHFGSSSSERNKLPFSSSPSERIQPLFSSSPSEWILLCVFHHQQGRRSNSHQVYRLCRIRYPNLLRYILLRNLLLGFAQHPVNARHRVVRQVDTAG